MKVPRGPILRVRVVPRARTNALAVESPSDERETEAWTLFADRAAIEAKLTADVRERIREEHGVNIAAPTPEAFDAIPA